VNIDGPLPLPERGYSPTDFQVILDRLLELQGPCSLPSSCLSPMQPSAVSISEDQPLIHLSSVLIGLRRDSRSLRRSCFELNLILEENPPIGIILKKLLRRETSEFSRIVEKWPVGSNTFIATSLSPINVEDDRYDHETHHFDRIGTWDRILELDGDSPRIKPTTTFREDILARMGLDEHAIIYSIYITQVDVSGIFLAVADGLTFDCRLT
jgi:hypothetical protein